MKKLTITRGTGRGDALTVADLEAFAIECADAGVPGGTPVTGHTHRDAGPPRLSRVLVEVEYADGDGPALPPPVPAMRAMTPEAPRRRPQA